MYQLSKTSPPTSRPRLGALLLGSALLAVPAFGGGTPATGTVTDQLQTPGGAGAKGSIGDYISSHETSTLSGPGLNKPYRFYIEVPQGATALQVDLFDADIMAGGAADITGERDQNRDIAGAVNTKTRYRLYDPSGNLVASRFNYGDDVHPSGGDNAWLKMYDNTTADITGGQTFADNFGTQAYTNNDGSQNFAAGWIESNDNGSATTGAIFVNAGGFLRLSNQGDVAPFTRQPALERQMDLSSYAAAVLSFDWVSGSGADLISAGFDSGDSFSVGVSSNGGATWHVLDEFGNISGTQSGTALYDISGHLSATTRIRLRITNRYAGTNEWVDIDNLQVRAVTTANGAAPDPGHWQLEVDLSGTVNGEIAGIRTRKQDDVNAFGMRAHDGDATAGGTEYNMYAHSFVIVGVNNNDRQRNYDLYPYMTKGCDADVHNFDFDSNAPNPAAPNTNVQPFGSITMISRSAGFSHTNTTVSGDDVWQSEPINSWVFDDNADEYGIWNMDVRIDDWDQNNYGPMYISTDLGTAAPPTASPDAETFRIYFPTDAGTAPAKAYMQQYLTYVEGQSAGPNPPGVGQTSRYAVTVVVANPTGSLGDITFSNTNVVTAHLPSGSETVYGGLAFVTAGSIVSQPAVSATTGDITWNPGTVSPGTSESLVYFVDITPTVVGNLVVTGTSGTGNGTRSTFIDETGAATFTFGELCRLQMTISPAVPVLVSEIALERVGGSPVVTFSTAGEAEAVTLDLYRLGPDGERIRVNEEPIGAQIGRPQGATYRLVDAGASLDGASYVLVETRVDGTRKSHGPFRAELRDAAPHASLPITVEAVPHPAPAVDAARLAEARTEEAPQKAYAGPNAEPAAFYQDRAVWVRVTESGIYRIEAQSLASVLGIGRRQAEWLLARRSVRLSLQGEDVTWRKVGRGDALEFYAEPLDNPFTAEQVYRLEIARGRVAAEPRNEPSPDWSAVRFVDSVHVEESTRPIVLMDIDPESDTWFWGYVSQGSRQASFPFRAHGVVEDEPATLRLHLQGAAAGQNVVQVTLNGYLLGNAQVDDMDASVVGFELPSGIAVDGANTLELELPGTGLVFLDSLDLVYSRRLEPENGALTVTGTADSWTAAPFDDDDLRVFDLRRPKTPRLVAVRALPEGDGYRAVWQGRGAGPFLVASRAGLKTPVLELDEASDLRNPANGADYLVITTRDLLPGAERLAAYRAAQGLDVMVVDIADIYDEMAHGLRDVRAVRDFLALAHSQWSSSPRYVVLLGAGTYDYQDFLGFGGNRIPVLLANNGSSLYGSDAALADFDGDGAPELAVGRIPVLSNAETDAFLAKIEGLESASGTWQERVRIYTDAYDVDDDERFADAGDHLTALLPQGFDTRHVTLDDHSLNEARGLLADDLSAGMSWLHYAGHGGVLRLSGEGLWTADDVAATSYGIHPVVSSVTCLINLHALPGYDALGEHLVLRDDGGAAAVFAPTWMVPSYPASFVGDRLFRQVFQKRTTRLGDATLAALRSAAELGVEGHILGTYQLLGDPATLLRALPSSAEGETCAPSCSGPG